MLTKKEAPDQKLVPSSIIYSYHYKQVEWHPERHFMVRQDEL